MDFGGRCGWIGDSSKRPVLSNDLSANASGYRCCMTSTTVFVKGETRAIVPKCVVSVIGRIGWICFGWYLTEVN